MVNVYKEISGKILEKKVFILKNIIRKQKKIINELNKILKDVLTDLNKVKNPRCPKCNSWNVIKRGTRKTIGRGRVQRYHCIDCDWKFTQRTIDYRMRHNKEVIKKIMKLRKQGKTYSQIAGEIGGVMTRQNVLRLLRKLQPPKKEVIIRRKQRNQWGEYERNFKIKI